MEELFGNASHFDDDKSDQGAFPDKRTNKDSKKKLFDWNDWHTKGFPVLETHSQAKLEILREYLIDYITIYCSGLPPGAPKFPLYIVDGFCGGGVYEEGQVGSPLVILQAIREAEFKVNQTRVNQISIDAKYIFIDDSEGAIDSLEQQLKNYGYGAQIGKTIHLRQNKFEDEYSTVCQQLASVHKRGGARVLFFLDQCGYSQVRPQMIKDISQRLPNAEFIVNFAVTWLSDFLNEDEGAKKLLVATGLDGVINFSDLVRKRNMEPRTSWAWTVESEVSIAYQLLSGMPYFSPFYISPKDNHRGYWLLHLAPHPKARQAMVAVHWRQANRIRHFGKSGTEILAYKAEEDENVYLQGVTFDRYEKTNVHKKLYQELPKILENKFTEGVSFNDMLADICNYTNADQGILSESIIKLFEEGDIKITGRNGGKKRKGAISINGSDILFPQDQQRFHFPKH